MARLVAGALLDGVPGRAGVIGPDRPVQHRHRIRESSDLPLRQAERLGDIATLAPVGAAFAGDVLQPFFDPLQVFAQLGDTPGVRGVGVGAQVVEVRHHLGR